jgi:hypothetical protein
MVTWDFTVDTSAECEQEFGIINSKKIQFDTQRDHESRTNLVVPFARGSGERRLAGELWCNVASIKVRTDVGLEVE